MASDPSSLPSLPRWVIASLNEQVVPRGNEDDDSGAIFTFLLVMFHPSRANWVVIPRGKLSHRTVQTYIRDPTDPDMTLPPYGAKVTTHSLECPDYRVIRKGCTLEEEEDIPVLAVLVKTLWESEEQAILTLVKWIETLPPPLNLPDDTPTPLGIILNGPKGAWLEVHPTAEGKAPEYTLSEYHNITSPEFLGFLHARTQVYEALMFSRAVANELSSIAEDCSLLPAHHFGGRAGRTTTDSMHLLTSFIKDAWRSKQVAAALFLDVTGAFPNASPKRLAFNMRKLGFPEQYVKWTERKLAGRTTLLRFDDFTSDPFEIEHGIDQGCPLSCIFYLIYNSDLIKVASEAKSSGELAVGYIDDVALLAKAETFELANAKLKNMMEKRGGALAWARSHTSEFALEKTALVGFHRYSTKCGDMKDAEIGGTMIRPTTSHKFLGVLFDSKLSWREHRAKVLKTATNWALLVRRVTKMNRGLKPAAARKLYSSVFIPKVTYAADIWWTPTINTPGKTKRTRSIGFTQKLQSAQRIIALGIAGALRTSPTHALISHAGILPIELELRTTTHRAAVRMAGIPLEHPLHRHVKKATSGSIVHHKSTLQTLFESSKVDRTRFATQPRSPTLPKVSKTLNPKIAEDKESAIREEKELDPTVKIFSDGSMVDGKVGAAAVLVRRGRPDRVLKIHLGPDKEHEVYEAEVIGLLLGLELLAGERNVWAAAIFLDNQAVLKTLCAGKTSNMGHLYAHLDKAMKKVKKSLPGVRLDTRWVPGHMDVEGNEKADVAAKEAARAINTSADGLLPRYLRGSIPINPTAAKRTRRNKMQEEWKEWVGDSERVQEWRYLDGTFPSMRFSHLASNLPREHYSLLTQLRIGHFPLADYLYKFKLSESRVCRLCDTHPETIFHILMSCHALDDIRAVRDQKLGAASRSFRALLQPGQGTLHVNTYVREVRSRLGALAIHEAEERGGEGGRRR